MTSPSFIPELLAPAGSLEKLKVAISYGADAVYLSGQSYGLRAAAENFTPSEIESGVKFARAHNAKVFITLNAFLHDEDMDGLGEFCEFLESTGVAAVIASDLGVIRVVQQNSNLPIHLSTQASCLNTAAAKVWKELGISRIIAARELSIAECREIKKTLGIEVETFVHGAMCMAYSGKCTISNFTAGRDSNRGGCIQSCRFSYGHQPEQGSSSSSLPIIEPEEEGTPGAQHFMSSKDLQGLELIPELFENRIDSLKIEGRMKSTLYVASVTRAYRKAIDAYASGNFNIEGIREELYAFPHREYASGSLAAPAGKESIYSRGGGSTDRATHHLLGLVLERNEELLAVRLHSGVGKGDEIEFLLFNGQVEPYTISEMYAVGGESIEQARQDSVVCLPVDTLSPEITESSVVRTLAQGVA